MRNRLSDIKYFVMNYQDFKRGRVAGLKSDFFQFYFVK